jgi:hypothetical protein
MKFRFGFVCAAIAIVLPGTVAAEYLSTRYYVPVVARNAGVAGSSWRTELCVSNPYSTTLTVEVYLHQNGDVGSHTVGVPSTRVVCNDDFILDWFGLTEFQGGLSAVAYHAENPDIEWPIFPLAVKVYNQTDHGTYGLSVNPIPAIDIEGEIHQDFMATGIHHFGTPGVDGFRTSIGVFNPEAEPQQVRMLVADQYGEIAWDRTEIVAGKSQVQFLLSQSISFIAGTAVISNLGTESSGLGEICPYVTVTDNETGDGRFIGAAQIWIQLIKSD